MSGVWPLFDASDLELRSRIYLNEAVADFYTQAEIWRWLSVAAKDIAQKTLCVRRVLDAQTTASTRTVSFNAYKPLFVEYISSGRFFTLPKIDPLKVGHNKLNGTIPQFWYTSGSTIGIDPIPDATYNLNLYVADIPKMVIAGITSFASGWSAGTGWTASTAASHTGATSGDLTYSTSLVASTNYTIEFIVTSLGTSGSVTPYIGATAGVPVTTNGYHTQNIISPSSSPILKFTAVNTLSLTGVNIFAEADFSAVTDQIELPVEWQNLMVLYAVYSGLLKDKRHQAAQMLESLYRSEMAYLKKNIIDVNPDSKTDVR